MNALASIQVSAATERNFPAKLASRIGLLVTLFAVELIIISNRVDTEALRGRGGFIGVIASSGAYILQSLVIFATVFLALGYSKAKAAALQISDELTGDPFRWGFLAAHCGVMAAFAVLSALVFGGARNHLEDLVALAWLGAGMAGICTGIFFFVPPKSLRRLLENTGSTWIYASAAAAATPAFVIASRHLWAPATAATFQLVRIFLQPFVSSVVMDPASSNIGTERFSVEISAWCSGLEGMGLMAVFSILWLGYFRRDYEFPRALLIIPLSLGAMFLLNAVRITALILIGNAGAPGVAVGGFHSQAGWLAFNGLALGLASVAHRIPWISARSTPAPRDDRAFQNPAEAYIAPFLAILAAAMISRATSGTFEWLYPLRFVAAGAALFVFRKKYFHASWKFGWTAPAVGGLVFLLWIVLDRVAGIRGDNGIAAGLAALSAPARIAWLAFRILAAVVTVPIAEELAFRGFLLRRFIAADFESVSFQRWTLLAAVGSSVAFGLLHGDRWIAGTVAGVLYAGAQKWRGRIGDAIVAHGITNALLAIWVLWGGHWSLW